MFRVVVVFVAFGVLCVGVGLGLMLRLWLCVSLCSACGVLVFAFVWFAVFGSVCVAFGLFGLVCALGVLCLIACCCVWFCCCLV